MVELNYHLMKLLLVYCHKNSCIKYLSNIFEANMILRLLCSYKQWCRRTGSLFVVISLINSEIYS